MIRNTLTALIPLLAAAETQDRCLGLVLSGGANNGSWEAGVLYGFLHNGTDPSEFEYDVVTGISAGSINTAAIAGWPKGTETEMVDWLSETWYNLTTSDVWVDWPVGKVEGLTIKPGMLDNSPLKAFLTETLSQFTEFGRNVTIGSANVDTGVFTEFNQTNIEYSDLPDAAVSSASIPVIFPPHVWSRGVFMDGGTEYAFDSEAAIYQCQQIVEDDSQIVIDVLICNGKSPLVQEEASRDAADNYLRARDIHKYYDNVRSLAQMRRAHPNVQFRYIVAQYEHAFTGLNLMDFDGNYTWPAQEQGRLDAVTVMNNTNGTNMLDHIDEWNNNSTIRTIYKSVGEYVALRWALNALSNTDCDASIEVCLAQEAIDLGEEAARGAFSSIRNFDHWPAVWWSLGIGALAWGVWILIKNI